MGGRPSYARPGNAPEEIAMTVQQDKHGNSQLAATRSAIAKIEHEGIRADLERFVAGAEVCLESREMFLALDSVRTIVSTVVALDRTIGPDVTLGILDGLTQDSEQTAIALQRGLGFTSTKNSKCDIKKGTPPGSSTCVAATNSTCYTLDSGSGCGSTSTRFQFVWEVAEVIA
jgi:hypothetical protein